MIPTRLIATLTKHMLWLPIMEALDNTQIDINTHKTIDAETKHTQEFHHINTNDLEDTETHNPTRLTAITRELDDLCQ